MKKRGDTRLTKSQAIAWLALLIAVNLAVYFPVFDMGYYSDDLGIIPLARGTATDILTLPGNPSSPMPPAYYRPVPMFMFWAIDKAGLESPWMHYAFNMALNLLNGFLIVLLIGQFVSGGWRTGQARAAVLATAIATAGFISALSVAWISQRFDIAAGFFMLLGLFLAVRWWSGGGAWNLAGVFLCAFLGMLSKELAFFFPLIIPFWYLQQRVLRPESRRSAARMAGATGAAALAAIVVTGIRYAAHVEVSGHILGVNLARMPYGFMKCMLEMLEPIRMGSIYGLWTEGELAKTGLVLLLGAAFLAPVAVLLWAAIGRIGWKRALAAVLPAVMVLSLFGLRGYAIPRLLYIPALVFWASAGCLAVTILPERRKAVFAALVLTLLLQSGAAHVIVRFYAGVSEHVQQTLLPSAKRIPKGSFIITASFNRLLFRQEGMHPLTPSSSWEDPIFEWLLYDRDAPSLTASWREPAVLTLEERLPNRFFHMYEGVFEEKSIYASGDTIRRPGYEVIVERTDPMNKIRSLRVEFDSLWLSKRSLYLDDDVTFRRLRP